MLVQNRIAIELASPLKDFELSRSGPTELIDGCYIAFTTCFLFWKAWIIPNKSCVIKAERMIRSCALKIWYVAASDKQYRSLTVKVTATCRGDSSVSCNTSKPTLACFHKVLKSLILATAQISDAVFPKQTILDDLFGWILFMLGAFNIKKIFTPKILCVRVVYVASHFSMVKILKGFMATEIKLKTIHCTNSLRNPNISTFAVFDTLGFT